MYLKNLINKDNVLFFLLKTLVILLPFNLKIISPVIIILVALSFCIGNRKDYIKNFKNNKYIYISSIVLYLCFVISIMWTDRIDLSVRDLIHKLSIIIFPIIFPLIEFIRKKIIVLLRFFTISNVIAVVICLSVSIFNLFFNDSLEEKYYIHFGTYHSMFLHRSYYAMYICISIWTLINKEVFKENFFKYFLILILILGLLFSESKIGFLTLIILIIVHVYLNFSKINKLLMSICLVISLVFFCLAYNKILDKFSKVIDGFNNELDITQVYALNSMQTRLILWESSLDVISKKIILGYGAGMSKNILRERNLECGYKPLTIYGRKYNAHNQFLEMWIELGVVGLIVLISLFYIGIVKNIERKSFYKAGIFLIFFVNFLTETVLDRQSGVIVFAFFVNLPYFLEKTNKT